MKALKNKFVLAIFLVIIIAITASILSIGSNKTSSTAVKVVNVGRSICTQDAPTSTCGPYDVEVQLIDGSERTYKVDGFNNGEKDLYKQISNGIDVAKQQNSTVILEIDAKGYIVEVR